MLGSASQSPIYFGEAPEPFKTVIEIIKSEMELEDDQVFVLQKRFNEPMDLRVYVALRVGPSKVFANNRREESVESGGMKEILSTNMQTSMYLDIYSRSIDALTRKEELLQALKSTFAEQKQEEKSFYIATLPTNFLDLSGIERSSIPYRFTCTVNVQYFKSKEKTIDYYDNYHA